MISRTKAVVAIAAVFVFIFAISAHAYEMMDCGGNVCHWSSYPVGYFMNEQGTPDLENEEEILQRSFNRWTPEHQTFCGPEFNYFGTTSIRKAELDYANVIFWVENNWEYHEDVLALTQCWFDNKGTFLDCDIEINGVNHSWSIGENADFGDIDLRSTLTHEIGHFWGIGHSNIKAATMYAYYSGRTNAADLDFDDIYGALETFCDEDVPSDDLYEQNDVRSMAPTWGMDPFYLTDLRLYDDDWYWLVVPPGKRAKVTITDENLQREKQVLYYDNDIVLDQWGCDGDCAVAFGEPMPEKDIRFVVVRQDFDEYPIETSSYTLRVEYVEPGQEGDIYDDDDSFDESACGGCDPSGAYGGTGGGFTNISRMSPAVALTPLLLIFLLYAVIGRRQRR